MSSYKVKTSPFQSRVGRPKAYKRIHFLYITVQNKKAVMANYIG